MYGELWVVTRAGRTLSCPDPVPRRLPTTPFDRHRDGGGSTDPRYTTVRTGPYAAVRVSCASTHRRTVGVRSDIPLPELKAMGKPSINAVLGR